MATLKVRNTYPRKQVSAVDMLIRSVKEASKEKVLTFARIAIDIATHYTPKYSGYATRGWTFSQGWKATTAYADLSSGDDALNYEGGIWDDNAEQLNREIVNYRMSYARRLVNKQIANRDRIHLTLMNRVWYSQNWLDQNQVVRLREVNEDYYTFEEILQESYGQYLSLGKFGRW